MTRLVLIGGDPAVANEYAQAARRLHDVSFAADAHNDRFDAVLIHVPGAQRVDIALQAAAAGKHVFLTSPLAPSVAEADTIIAACLSAGVQLMVGPSARFRPAIVAVKTALDSGKLGSPALLRLHAWDERSAVTDSADSASTTPKVDDWSRLTEQLDLAAWLFGASPTEVFAVGRNSSTTIPASLDYVQIHLGFPREGMALLTVSRSLPPGPGYDSLTVIGSTGAAYADDQHQMQLMFGGGPPAALKTSEGVLAIAAQLREFTAAIQQNRAPSVSGADGRRALQLTEAVKKSLREGEAVHLSGGHGASQP